MNLFAFALSSSVLFTGTFSKKVWVGGSDRASEDVWIWQDGTLLGERRCSKIDFDKEDLLHPCNEWADSYPKGGTAKNCLSVQNGIWFSDDCSDRKRFACQFDPSTINGNQTRKLSLRDVDFHTIELWLRKKSKSKNKIDNSQM